MNPTRVAPIVATGLVFLLVGAFLSLRGQPRTSALAAGPALVAGFDVSAPVARWALPAELSEVSGLAAAGPGAVLAHADERATIVEFDYRRGTRLRTFTLRQPPLKGDFEGIEIVGRRISLMTSDGRIFSGDIPASGTVIKPVVMDDTGLGRRCELEGLSSDGRGNLLLPCKAPLRRSATADFTVWTWSPTTRAAPTPTPFRLPAGRGQHLHPSAIVTTRAGTRLILFGVERAIGEFAANGTPLSLWQFTARAHPQPEGIAISDDGMLLIADEAAGPAKQATLTVYGVGTDFVR